MQLYIGVQGIVKDVTADYTIWFEPGPDDGPLKGIKPWSGILIIVLLILFVILACGFLIFVYLKRSVSGHRESFFAHSLARSLQNKLENISFRSGGKKAPKMTEYDDGSGTGMIPLDQVDNEMPQMRDAKSMVHITNQPQRNQSQQWNVDTRQNSGTIYNQGQANQQRAGNTIGSGGSFGGNQPAFYGGDGTTIDYEQDSPQLYDLSGQQRQSDFHSAQGSNIYPHQQTQLQDDTEMKPLF